MKEIKKRCKCLDCNGMGFTGVCEYYNSWHNMVSSRQSECQSCLGSGWLHEKDFLEQMKHHPNKSNLEIIEAYENGPNREIPM
ncbi:MAG: hypothetical protein V3U54_08735 [Thermodesulfobacteriota bacterium]